MNMDLNPRIIVCDASRFVVAPEPGLQRILFEVSAEATYRHVCRLRSPLLFHRIMSIRSLLHLKSNSSTRTSPAENFSKSCKKSVLPGLFFAIPGSCCGIIYSGILTNRPSIILTAMCFWSARDSRSSLSYTSTLLLPRAGPCWRFSAGYCCAQGS